MQGMDNLTSSNNIGITASSFWNQNNQKTKVQINRQIEMKKLVKKQQKWKK